jgi:hypothetical protein
MKINSYILAIVIMVFVSTLHGMESALINPDIFTQKGKEYMENSVNSWVKAAEQGATTTGLANIFKKIKKEGIDSLIQNKKALKHANEGYVKMVENGVFEALDALKIFDKFNYDGTQELKDDLRLVIMQAVGLHVLKGWCPEFKIPAEEGLLVTFALLSSGSENASSRILELNKQLHNTAAPYIGASILIIGYFAQTDAGK